jgi:hypothetical protein
MHDVKRLAGRTAAAMLVIETRGGRGKDRDSRVVRDRAVRGGRRVEDFTDVGAADELHRDVMLGVVDVDLEHAAEVVVVEHRE